MGTHTTPAGFRQISRRNSMFEERVHDAYKARYKLPEPTVGHNATRGGYSMKAVALVKPYRMPSRAT